MGRFGAVEIMLVVVVIILLFGWKKLPEIGESVGKALREFRKAGKDSDDESDRKK
ncbi:MAG: twin-arginine translocase TatA/TatE family subunit [Candidatus Omnitrophica bacterium]|nr:twin-arginine translocase TatA/TatE family subunit [Candidatus Omnitrophota bacterium]MCB9747325.1 twin-arginine translocase TatA/TatE family subunit [Candidatus Omnitrophota bacterium]